MRRSFAPAAEPRPIADINTTPLIDVMLVLLIMIILTVPSPTHKVAVDLPSGGTGEAPRVYNLDIDAAGRLFWNGAPLAQGALPAKLRAMKADAVPHALHMRADAETPYVRFDETLADVKRAGVTRLGFVGNERYATF